MGFPHSKAGELFNVLKNQHLRWCYLHSIDESSTLGDTDKFFKYVIGCTLLLVILFTFLLATFLFGVLAEFISMEQGDLQVKVHYQKMMM